MEMGTGKSLVLLMDWLVSGHRDLLIIAPAGSYRNWFKEGGEFDKHLKLDFVWAAWASHVTKANTEHLQKLLDTRKRRRILIVNVEALSTVEAARVLCRQFLGARDAMLAVDESTTIKSYNSKRTKFINFTLAPLARARRIMSGLPTPRSPLDLYSQFEFLNWTIVGQRSYFAFRRCYAVEREIPVGGRKIKIVVGYRNTELLQSKIAPYQYRVLKSDCLDLPPKVYEMRDVELTEEQRRLYGELKEHATTRLSEESYITATAVITQLLRLHQILCGYTIDENGMRHEVPTKRLSALLEILEEHDGKAIIWAPYDHSIRLISEALKKEYGENSVAMFWGGNQASRSGEEVNFLTNPDCRFMVSTPAAGGLGNNWTVANLVVYYANNYDLAHRYQSEDRAHRVGQEAFSVTYIDLVAPGTVDEKILKALRAKIDLATAITGENYREWLV